MPHAAGGELVQRGEQIVTEPFEIVVGQPAFRAQQATERAAWRSSPPAY